MGDLTQKVHIVSTGFSTAESRCEPFEYLTDPVRIDKFLSAKGPYYETQLARAGHKTELFEGLQTLTDYGLRNPVFLRKRDLAKRVAGLEFPIEYSGLNRIDDSLAASS